MNADNRTIALVTGGNRGLGIEECRQLAAKGITVILGARDSQKGAAGIVWAALLPDDGPTRALLP